MDKYQPLLKGPLQRYYDFLWFLLIYHLHIVHTHRNEDGTYQYKKKGKGNWFSSCKGFLQSAMIQYVSMQYVAILTLKTLPTGLTCNTSPTGCVNQPWELLRYFSLPASFRIRCIRHSPDAKDESGVTTELSFLTTMGIGWKISTKRFRWCQVHLIVLGIFGLFYFVIMERREGI